MTSELYQHHEEPCRISTVTPNHIHVLATREYTTKTTRQRTNLNVSRGDLQRHRKTVVVETLVESYECTVNARLDEIVRKLLQSDRLNPLDHSLVRPNQHI